MGIAPLAATPAARSWLLVGGSIVVGGAGAAMGSAMMRHATEESGQTATLAAMGSAPVVAGAVAGLFGAGALGRLGVGAARYLTIPVGIGGAITGSQVMRAQLDSKHADTWAAHARDANAIVADTQAMFRAAGADADALTEVPLAFDARYFNASYALPRGDQGHEIRIGRSPTTGSPLLGDVVAHEFAHRVVHAMAPGLGYRYEAGAIHESLADTFAAAVDTDDWLVGEDAFPPDGIRSLADPGRAGAGGGQPTTRSEANPNGEVHKNAGIGNKVAYRVGEALGRDVMAKIYVAALDDARLDADATFDDLAAATRAAAADLYGASSSEFAAVDDAWNRAEYPASGARDAAPADAQALDATDLPSVVI